MVQNIKRKSRTTLLGTAVTVHFDGCQFLSFVTCTNRSMVCHLVVEEWHGHWTAGAVQWALVPGKIADKGTTCPCSRTLWCRILFFFFLTLLVFTWNFSPAWSPAFLCSVFSWGTVRCYIGLFTFLFFFNNPRHGTVTFSENKWGGYRVEIVACQEIFN